MILFLIKHFRQQHFVFIDIGMPYLCITRDTSVESYDIGRGLPNDLGMFLYDQSIRYEESSV